MGKQIEKITLQQHKINTELIEKNQEIQRFFSDKNNFKSSIILKETDWLSVIPTDYAHGYTADSTGYLIEYIPIDQNLYFDCPHLLSHFVNFEILIKPLTNVNVIGLLPSIEKIYSTGYCEVYGNSSNLIYKGYSRPLNWVFSQTDLNTGNFQESFTKKIYNGNIIYNKSGHDWLISNSNGIIKTIILEKNVGLSPYGNQNIDCWQSSSYQGTTSKILNLLNTTVTMISTKTEIRWLPIIPVPLDPPYEYIQETYFDNIIITKNFAEMDREYYRIDNTSLYKKVDDNWVFQSYGTYFFDSNDSSLFSRFFIFKGYWLFYDSNLNNLFGIQNVSPPIYELGFVKQELVNLPTGDNRVWSTITFKKDYGNYPLIGDFNYLPVSEQQHSLFKVDKIESTKYKANIVGNIILQNSNLVPKGGSYTVSYLDTYYQHDDSYSVTENHSKKDLSYYGLKKRLASVPNANSLPLTGNNFNDARVTIDSQHLWIWNGHVWVDKGEEDKTDWTTNVQYKIRISLINPYYFDDKQNYEL